MTKRRIQKEPAPRWFVHKETGRQYRYCSSIKCKVEGDWQEFVFYENAEGERYARSRWDFNRKFVELKV